MAHVPIAEDGRVDTDRPLVRRRVVRRVHEQRLQVGARGELRGGETAGSQGGELRGGTAGSQGGGAWGTVGSQGRGDWV